MQRRAGRAGLAGKFVPGEARKARAVHKGLKVCGEEREAGRQGRRVWQGSVRSFLASFLLNKVRGRQWQSVRTG